MMFPLQHNEANTQHGFAYKAAKAKAPQAHSQSLECFKCSSSWALHGQTAKDPSGTAENSNTQEERSWFQRLKLDVFYCKNIFSILQPKFERTINFSHGNSVFYSQLVPILRNEENLLITALLILRSCFTFMCYWTDLLF